MRPFRPTSSAVPQGLAVRPGNGGNQKSRRVLLAGVTATLVLTVVGCSPSPEYDEVPAPGAAGESDPVARARSIHDRVLVLDAHADIVPPGTTSRYGDEDGSSKVTPEKMAAGGVDAVVMALAVGSGPRSAAGDAEARATADAELRGVLEVVGAHDNLVLARTASELEGAHEKGQLAYMLGLQNARIFEGKIATIDELYAAGVRVFALTHIGHNDFADSSRPVYDGDSGSYEPAEEHGGLSKLGRAAVERINELGGIVDVSQLSVQATLQATNLSTTPVIASHSNVKALSQVARNLSDAEIDRIGNRGGVVHIAAFTAYLLDLADEQLIEDIRGLRRKAGIDERYTYPYELYWEIEDPEAQGAFLTAMRDLLGPATVDRMIDHIDYVVERIGVDHVGLGNDFNHGGGILDLGNASDAFNMTLGLVRRGYSQEEIAKIWSGNFLRVLRQAEAAAAKP